MRSYTLNLTPRQATEMAQEIHNEIDANGEIEQPKIIGLLVEELSEKLAYWLEENIDWGQIESNDLEAREDYKEYFSQQLRGWAN